MAAEDTDQDQKTEEATSKRLDEAREQGQLPISREMTTFISLLAIFFVLASLAPSMCTKMVNALVVFINAPDQISLEGANLQNVILTAMTNVGLATIVVFSFLVVGSLLGTMLQTSFFFSFDMIKFDPERLSVIAGIKRLFSPMALAELVRSLIKFFFVGGVAFMMFVPLIKTLPSYTGLALIDVMRALYHEIVHILSVLLIIVAIMAIADFVFQRFTFYRGLRMTKQEVKDEYKQMEGDPKIKSRLRQMRLERARKRMIANVPKADVVVTNPTHYSVALKYDNKKMRAPIVIAKGIDQVALRIREVAKDSHVPLVSNPPLARTLYDNVDIDNPIKAEHYKAVAEIISYVYKLKKKVLN